ncbi:hypothetical protein Acr_03g0013170 [Actinidia rufa]|uniref:Uncharacterized protein n=1 Tax=Actinidia rufa TaxID=165716 RepID=A0A7J0EDJ8_9ERIC|nr:hypothetical protein Acr_03g0013170 [Actinidia rufa]
MQPPNSRLRIRPIISEPPRKRFVGSGPVRVWFWPRIVGPKRQRRFVGSRWRRRGERGPQARLSLCESSIVPQGSGQGGHGSGPGPGGLAPVRAVAAGSSGPEGEHHGDHVHVSAVARWMFMFGPVKFQPEMNVAEIKKRRSHPAD